MAAEHTYDYAVIRIVPRVQRGEMVNVGVILVVRGAGVRGVHRGGRSAVLALDPAVDMDAVRAHLATISAICKGGPDAVRSASSRRAAASAGWCRRGAPSSRRHRSIPVEPATPPRRSSG